MTNNKVLRQNNVVTMELLNLLEGWSFGRVTNAVRENIKNVQIGHSVTHDDEVHAHTYAGKCGSAFTVISINFARTLSTPRNCFSIVFDVIEGNKIATCRNPNEFKIMRWFDDDELNDELAQLFNILTEFNENKCVKYYQQFETNNKLTNHKGLSAIVDGVKFCTSVFYYSAFTLPSIVRRLVIADEDYQAPSLKVLTAAREAREIMDPTLVNVKTFADVIALMPPDAVTLYVDDDCLIVGRVNNFNHVFIMHDGRPLLMCATFQPTVATANDDTKLCKKLNTYCARKTSTYRRRMVVTSALCGSPCE